MIEYIVEGVRFSFSYQQVREEHRRFCLMSDKEFIENLASAAHLACFICYLKEIPAYVCLSDKGIVHELIHLIHIPDGNTTSLREIRNLFREQLNLS